MITRRASLVCALTAVLCLGALPGAQAQTTAAAAPTAPTRGPETNLPMPRFVSMKAPKGNVRRGPSRTHRVDWVFKRRNMPVQVIAEFGHWRRVVDRDGHGGWMHYSLLSGARYVLVERDMMELRAEPLPEARVTAYAEAGVVARLRSCPGDGWCALEVGSAEGWAQTSDLWGVAADEVRE